MDTTHDNNGDASKQADNRMIHALLLHLHDDRAADHRERRVQRVIQAVRETPRPQGLPPESSVGVPVPRAVRFSSWARRGAWAAAALIPIAICLWIFTYNPAVAMASLDDIIDALERPGDRTYRVRMKDLHVPPRRRPPAEKWPRRVPRPGLDGATLYLRDGRQYLLIRHGPKGGLIYDGYDGRQSWRVKDGAIAEVREGLGAGGIQMPPIMGDIPFSDLHQTLARIRVDYTVEGLSQAPLPSGGEMLRYVKVRRNSRKVKGPDSIEIWADPKSAMPERIVFDDAKIQGNRQPCRITFDLVSEEPLSPDWFTPAPHISAGR